MDVSPFRTLEQREDADVQRMQMCGACSALRWAAHSSLVATNPVSLVEPPRGFWVCFVCFDLITFLEM